MTIEQLFTKLQNGTLTKSEHREAIIENLRSLDKKIKNEKNKNYLSFWISQVASNLKEAQKNQLFNNELDTLTAELRKTIKGATNE